MDILSNQLSNIYTIGIWQGNSVYGRVKGNTINLKGSRGVNTTQISPNNPVTGIEATHFLDGKDANGSWLEQVTMQNNLVNGDHADDQANYKVQNGLLASGELYVRANTFGNLSAGLVNSAQGLRAFDNKFTDCLTGVRVGGGLLSATLQCNTFETTGSFTAPVYGIWAVPNSTLSSLGTATQPCGNKFALSAASTGIQNDGSSSAVYYRYNSLHETFLYSNLSVMTSSLSPTSACSNRGAANGGGVNVRASQGQSSSAYMQAVMDSLRTQQLPARRQTLYQAQLAQYYVGQSDLPALATYTATLATTNPTAYYGLSLHLLRAYVAQHQPKQAQAMAQRLQPVAATNKELQQEMNLLILQPRIPTWPPVGSRLPAADSLLLDHIAQSGTAVAEQAATWLRYYYPHAAPYRELQPMPVARPAVVETDQAPLLPEGALYPNPAAATATARYLATGAGQTAELQIFNLLTSQQVLTLRLPATKGTATECVVDLQQLPQGQYGYRFVIGGRVQAAHHLIIQK